jgi:hypothetical protein
MLHPGKHLAVRDAAMPNESESPSSVETFRHTDHAATGRFLRRRQHASQGIRICAARPTCDFLALLSRFSLKCLLFLLRAALWSRPAPHRLLHPTTCTHPCSRQQTLSSSTRKWNEEALGCTQLVTPAARGAPPPRAASKHCPSRLSTTSSRTWSIRGLDCQGSQRLKVRPSSVQKIGPTSRSART